MKCKCGHDQSEHDQSGRGTACTVPASSSSDVIYADRCFRFDPEDSDTVPCICGHEWRDHGIMYRMTGSDSGCGHMGCRCTEYTKIETVNEEETEVMKDDGCKPKPKPKPRPKLNFDIYVS